MSAAWPWLLEQVAMPAAAALTPHRAWRYFQEYERADRDEPAAREARVLCRLQELIAHAYDRVLLYRDKMQGAGIEPTDIRSLDDLRRIPVTTRHELREAFPHRAIARGHEDHSLRYSNTSGTTGRPLMLVQDVEDINHKYAVRLRARAMYGSRLGERTLRTTPNECQPCLAHGDELRGGWLGNLGALLARSGVLAPEHFVVLEQKIVKPLFHRRRKLDPLGPDELGPARFEQILAELERYGPALWVTYPLYAYLMARHVRRSGRRVPRVGAIDLSGGVASSVMRETISEVFGAPCYEGYGACELGRYAGECEIRPGLVHVVEDHCVNEVLRPDGEPAAEGELGNHIVTGLTSFAMPIIRLEQGDVVVDHGRGCACGRTTRCIDVRGRIQTLVRMPGGRVAAEKDLLDALLPAPGVEIFQLLQREEARFELHAVPEPGAAPDARDLIKRVRGVLGADAEVEVRTVDQIAQEGSGKYMHVKSRSYDRFRCVSSEQLAGDRYTVRHAH